MEGTVGMQVKIGFQGEVGRMAVETSILGPQHLVAGSASSLALVSFHQLETSSGSLESASVVGFPQEMRIGGAPVGGGFSIDSSMTKYVVVQMLETSDVVQGDPGSAIGEVYDDGVYRG